MFASNTIELLSAFSLQDIVDNNDITATKLIIFLVIILFLH
ncbi:hypothetical protein JIP1600_1120004 [Flavobacterium psychrophilum]|nr:hypothetical protein JIP1600_1120004 [Flavobacterium psychrophilum]SNB06090.1 hypothetical protein KU05112810_1640006 [Flavobacterium psychrophilum]